MRLLAATFAALALAAAGCGGDEEGEPIPAERADDLITVLGLIEGNVESGACSGAESKVRQDLQPKIENLPRDVDADVRSALEDSADRLLQLIETECGEDEEQQDTDTTETETDTGPVEPVEPPDTDTDTQPTETDTQPTQPQTQPPDTQPEQPPDEEPLPPDDGGVTAPGSGDTGGADSGGNGNGNGRGRGATR